MSFISLDYSRPLTESGFKVLAYRKTEFVENKRAQKRERIVSAARGLVEAGGWSNCILTRVAEQAGVSTGSLYSYFNKITDLYIEVFDVIAKEELAIISEIADQSAPASIRFERAVDTFAHRALKGPVRAYAVMGEPVALEVDQVRQQGHALFIAEFEKIIADGVAAGELRPQNPRISAACVLGLLIETLVIPLSNDAPPLANQTQEIRAEILNFSRFAVGMKNHPS